MSSDRFGGLPKKGDLIEASCGRYKHWFVYVGHGFVVHLTDVDSGGFLYGRSARALVRKDPLPKHDKIYKYRIKNKYDNKMEPRCAETIVLSAELMVGKEIPNSHRNCTSEHFVTQMRYGVPMCEQCRFGPKPKPGDLIEIFRGLFEHWAVYVGEDYVVHLTNIDSGVSGIYMIGSVSGLSTKAMVKKELLTKAASGNKYWVNNKHDQKMQPRCAEEIVRLAEEQVGKVMSYHLTSSNCEHFVTDLRYGVPTCDQVQKKESDLLTMAMSMVDPLTDVNYGRQMPSTSWDEFGDQPKKGDLIEASCGLFKHWAVYLEDGYVVHMTKLEFEVSESGKSARAVVRKNLLPELDQGYRYRINNKYDKKMEPLCAEDIVRRAEEMVGKEILYRRTNYNYQHFVTELRYGVPMCDPVQIIVPAVLSGVVSFLFNGSQRLSNY